MVEVPGTSRVLPWGHCDIPNANSGAWVARSLAVRLYRRGTRLHTAAGGLDAMNAPGGQMLPAMWAIVIEAYRNTMYYALPI